MNNTNHPKAPVAVEIRQVANGFLVTGCTRNFSRGGEGEAIDTSQVYQTMASLVDFLKKHFDHRESMVLLDDVNMPDRPFYAPGTTVLR